MKSARILIVEDEAITAADLAEIVAQMGHEVVGVTAYAEDAIEFAASLKPDLVLMDIQLAGEMDGTSAAEVIHRRYGVPVVFLTAFSDPETLMRAKPAIPYAFLVKPITEPELRIHLDIALNLRGSERMLQDSERWLHDALDSIGVGIVATDGQGAVQFLNPVGEALTGWGAAAAKGRPLEEVLRLAGESAPRGSDLHTRVLREGRLGWTTGAWIVRRDGERVPIDYTACPISHGRDTPAGVSIIFRDLAEWRRRAPHHASDLDRFEGLLATATSAPEGAAIPLCASCKKVRAGTGAWEHAEPFLGRPEGVGITHTFCPECLETLYAGVPAR